MADGFAPATAANSGPLVMNYSTTPDPAKYLPAGAPADRYKALVQRVEDLRALCVPFDTRHQASLDMDSRRWPPARRCLRRCALTDG